MKKLPIPPVNAFYPRREGTAGTIGKENPSIKLFDLLGLFMVHCGMRRISNLIFKLRYKYDPRFKKRMDDFWMPIFGFSNNRPDWNVKITS